MNSKISRRLAVTSLRKRLSKPTYSSTTPHQMLEMSQHAAVHQLIDGIANRIVPFPENEQRPYRFYLESGNQKSERVLARSFYAYGRDLTRSTHHLIISMTKELLRLGEVRYQTVEAHDDNDPDPDEDIFSLARAPNVSQTSDKRQDVDFPQLSLNVADIGVDWARVVFDLAAVEPLFPEGFISEAGFMIGNDPPFDVNDYREARHLAELAATRSVGYVSPMDMGNAISEYYQCQRLIKFEKFVVTLRDYILERLNNYLVSQRPSLGLPLQHRGLMSVGEFTILEHMLENQFPINDILKILYPGPFTK